MSNDNKLKYSNLSEKTFIEDVFSKIYDDLQNIMSKLSHEVLTKPEKFKKTKEEQENIEVVHYDKLKYLIVDDDYIMRMCLEETVKVIWIPDNNVDFFDDWDKVVEYIELQLERWKIANKKWIKWFNICDVIFMDLQMVNMDWDEATEKIKELYKKYNIDHPKIILQTSNYDIDEVKNDKRFCHVSDKLNLHNFKENVDEVMLK